MRKISSSFVSVSDCDRMTEVAVNELPSEMESDNDTDDDSFLPDTNDPSGSGGSGSGAIAGAGSPASVRLILPKTRLGIQRRATVTGASPTSTRPPHNIEQVSTIHQVLGIFQDFPRPSPFSFSPIYGTSLRIPTCLFSRTISNGRWSLSKMNTNSSWTSRKTLQDCRMNLRDALSSVIPGQFFRIVGMVWSHLGNLLKLGKEKKRKVLGSGFQTARLNYSTDFIYD